LCGWLTSQILHLAQLLKLKLKSLTELGHLAAAMKTIEVSLARTPSRVLSLRFVLWHLTSLHLFASQEIFFIKQTCDVELNSVYMGLQRESINAGTFTGTKKFFKGWILVEFEEQIQTPPSDVRAGRTGEQGEQACEQPEGGWPKLDSDSDSSPLLTYQSASSDSDSDLPSPRGVAGGEVPPGVSPEGRCLA
jgi:hypothetical protein